MELEDIARLYKNCDLLLQDMKAEHVLDYLDQEGILDLEDRERIMAQTTSQEKVHKLLEILPTRGSDAFRVFLISLRESYPHLALSLISTTISDTDITQGVLSVKKQNDHDEGILTEIRQELIQRYEEDFTKTDPIPWSEDFVLSLNAVYTPLDIHSKDTINRQFVPKHSEEDLFTPQPGYTTPPRRIYVDGVAGSGKTALCQKLAYDWATEANNNSMSQFKLVFYIQLVHLTETKTLTDLLYEQLFPKDFKFSKEEVVKYVTQNQSHVLVVLDGLNMASVETTNVVIEYLKGKILHQTYCLLTSRPTGLSNKYFDLRLRSKGFTLENSKIFVAKFFSFTEVDFYGELIQRIDNHPFIQQMSQNPFNMLLLCLLWDDNQGNFPKSITDLFQDIIHALVRRYCHNYHIVKSHLDDADVYEQIQNDIGRIAFYGVTENKSEFTEKEVVGLIDKEIYESDFLTKLPKPSRLKPGTSFSFTHRNLQEMFAAMHISKMSADEIKRYFVQFLQNRPTRIICIFIIGLLRNDSERLVTLFQILSNFNQQSEDKIIVNTHQGCDRDAKTSYEFNKNMRVYSASLHALNEADNPENCTKIIAAGPYRDLFLDIKAFQNHYLWSDFRNAAFSVLQKISNPRAVMFIELLVFGSSDPNNMMDAVFRVLTNIAVDSSEKFQLFVYCDGLNHLGFGTMQFILDSLCKLNSNEGVFHKFLERKVESINFLNHCCTMLREMSEEEMREELSVNHPLSKNLPPVVIYKNVLACPSKSFPSLYKSDVVSDVVKQKSDCCVQKEGDLAAKIFKECNPDLNVTIKTAEIPADFILDL